MDAGGCHHGACGGGRPRRAAVTVETDVESLTRLQRVRDDIMLGASPPPPFPCAASRGVFAAIPRPFCVPGIDSHDDPACTGLPARFRTQPCDYEPCHYELRHYELCYHEIWFHNFSRGAGEQRASCSRAW